MDDRATGSNCHFVWQLLPVHVMLAVMVASKLPASMLEVSRAVVQLMIDRGSSDFSVKELAAHAGISERTFYRYFPRKEDAVRPFLMNGVARIAALVEARPKQESIQTSLREAISETWWVKHADRSRAIFDLVHETDSLRSVWLQVVADSEAKLSEVIASRLGIDAHSRQARLAGVVVAAAVRMSNETFIDSEADETPAQAFAHHLRLLHAVFKKGN